MIASNRRLNRKPVALQFKVINRLLTSSQPSHERTPLKPSTLNDTNSKTLKNAWIVTSCFSIPLWIPFSCFLQLVEMLTTYRVNEEKEVFNMKVSTKVLDSLTPQEIRDLRVVFEAFDVNQDEWVAFCQSGDGQDHCFLAYCQPLRIGYSYSLVILLTHLDIGEHITQYSRVALWWSVRVTTMRKWVQIPITGGSRCQYELLAQNKSSPFMVLHATLMVLHAKP